VEKATERPRAAALLAAAGEGLRLGRGPKAFLTVAGSTLLERAIGVLSGLVDEIVVALPPAGLPQATRAIGHARVIAGGASRQMTVLKLLQASEAQIVLVHDVARPFLAKEVVERVLEAAVTHGAASAARPVADTLIDAASGAAVDRDLLRAVQTPQGFRRDVLLAAHLAAVAERREATDDASLVRALGGEVALVAGSPWLFKVTTAEDLEFAQAVSPAWDKAAAGSRSGSSHGG
jgi:2-C-methyl-D-erythritol 4-phosphate cytidylyltransferase